MKNLIIELLPKLAKATYQMKELTAQVEAQSLLLAALVLTLKKTDTANLATNIEKAIMVANAASKEMIQSDVDLVLAQIVRLITVTQLLEVDMTAAAPCRT